MTRFTGQAFFVGDSCHCYGARRGHRGEYGNRGDQHGSRDHDGGHGCGYGATKGAGGVLSRALLAASLITQRSPAHHRNGFGQW